MRNFARRFMWSSLLIALLSMVFLVSTNTASAHATTADSSSSLVGTWTLQVILPAPYAPQQQVVTFYSNHTLTSPPVTVNGLTHGTAYGVWLQSDNHISFVIVVPEYSDPQQTHQVDTVVGQQSGTIDGDTFTCQGTGTVIGLNGNVLGTLSVQISATRN